MALVGVGSGGKTAGNEEPIGSYSPSPRER